MERKTVTRTLRAVRRRKGLSQRVLGRRLGVSQATVSRWERTALEDCSGVELEAWAQALGAHASIELRLDGERPLVDQKHAQMQNWLVGYLRRAGWVAEAEVSFNHFGDRGRIDVLAFHPIIQCLLVVEIKTRFADAQDLIGRLDVKRRIAPKLAVERGWRPATAVGALVFSESTTTRRRLIAHRELLAGYSLRGRTAMAWLRRPRLPVPSGILALVAAPIER
jgi:transcriptional regulator with XRE-family HTH domain